MKHLAASQPTPDRIRLARLQQGLSQENMADLLGLSTTAYGDIERGKTELTLTRLAQIADVLRTSVVDLISDVPAAIEPTIIAPNELEKLRNTVERQQLELDKLRLEVDYHKRRYDERIALELAWAIGQKQERPKIGF
ncbi:helix-turn-helix domain-containing protein [Fibrella forsythiae]|uniref:Helix-turn-helix transcriptional regulator n=1 Tax=Fibrella forsythiae TaxID=2817061 RepID=A0ABS3JNB5_9BACT|nr:helix-turn-helix domain-containing protein [Fibrella forsythiae]MBO0950968.1 helix-turn-helix transcriptional regulator [Fibrella forsythiae]